MIDNCCLKCCLCMHINAELDYSFVHGFMDYITPARRCAIAHTFVEGSCSTCCNSCSSNAKACILFVTDITPGADPESFWGVGGGWMIGSNLYVWRGIEEIRGLGDLAGVLCEKFEAEGLSFL